jgi:hypothetical protein
MRWLVVCLVGDAGVYVAVLVRGELSPPKVDDWTFSHCWFHARLVGGFGDL